MPFTIIRSLVNEKHNIRYHMGFDFTGRIDFMTNREMHS